MAPTLFDQQKDKIVPKRIVSLDDTDGGLIYTEKNEFIEHGNGKKRK